MSSNPQPKIDTHQISLDLDGLDDFLEATQEIIEAPEVEIIASQIAETEEIPDEERTLLLKLLGQVSDVNSAVEEARDRLAAANERMTSLATVVQLQTGQLELLSHYQNQAARTTSLERQIAELQLQNMKLNQVWWRRLIAFFKGQA